MAKDFWKKHTDKIGVVGSVFAALCCLGFPALLSILSARRLGFLINDAVLCCVSAVEVIFCARAFPKTLHIIWNEIT